MYCQTCILIAVTLGEFLTDRLIHVDRFNNSDLTNQDLLKTMNEISFPRQIDLKVSLPLFVPKERK